MSKRRRPYLVVSGAPWNLEPAYPRVTVFRDVLVERVAQLPPRRLREVERALSLYLSLVRA